MVEDVASDRLSVPKFIAQLALKLMSSQIEERVHFDIMKLQPATFARNCSVPCVFIIGRHDRLVFPKRVLEIFDAYLGKQKTLIHSNGDHSSEREPHVLQQCYGFILQEITKNLHARAMPEQPLRFLDRIVGNGLLQMKNEFEAKFEQSGGGRQQRRDAGPVWGRHSAYNFDFYLDETRNEERMANADDRFDEYDYGEVSGRTPHRRNMSNSDRSMSFMIKGNDTHFVGSAHDISDTTKDDLQTYVKELSRGMYQASTNKGRRFN